MRCASSRSPTGPSSTAPFDRGAAAAGLASAAGAAKGCKRETGPGGSASVTLVFAPSGAVTSAAVGAPYAGTPTGACIVTAFRQVRVPAFAGPEVTVTKSVNL